MLPNTFEAGARRSSSRGAVQVLEIALEVNGRLFRNACDGVTAEDFSVRVTDRMNPMLWIAGHIARMREHMARLLDAFLDDHSDDQRMRAFDQPFDPKASYPEKDEILAAWNEVTWALHSRLRVASEADLTCPAPMAFPVGEQTIGDSLSFFVQHEGHHVGQLALLRRALGYEPARYA
jgi:uncharacterized damage-inducible protein DinB